MAVAVAGIMTGACGGPRGCSALKRVHGNPRINGVDGRRAHGRWRGCRATRSAAEEGGLHWTRPGRQDERFFLWRPGGRRGCCRPAKRAAGKRRCCGWLRAVPAVSDGTAATTVDRLIHASALLCYAVLALAAFCSQLLIAQTFRTSGK